MAELTRQNQPHRHQKWQGVANEVGAPEEVESPLRSVMDDEKVEERGQRDRPQNRTERRVGSEEGLRLAEAVDVGSDVFVALEVVLVEVDREAD